MANILEEIVNDPTLFQANSWTFFIPYDQSLNNGWNAADIEGLLVQYGVKTWGKQITAGEFFFSVNLSQAQWTEHLLSTYGVPIQEKSLGAPRSHRKSNQQETNKDVLSFFFEEFFFDDPPPRRPQPSTKAPLSFLDDFFDKYF